MKKHQFTDLLGGSVEVETADGPVQFAIAGIEIPIIQRDYAQGRPEELPILSRFLDALFGALSEDRELELDFVYGSIRGSAARSDNIFLPLDGQQRLTTLFLLHWYIGNAELQAADQQLFLSRLTGFRYATRGTASLFCEQLARVTVTINTAHHITQAYWYHKNFEKDPTVMAMLNTIREIEKRYRKQEAKLFRRLHRLCFYLLPLDGFNLTDELYIKMNARGKQLTDFENLKADLVGHLKSELHPDHGQLHATVAYGQSEVPYYLALASKIDNSWTDIFWAVARSNEKDEDKNVDAFFLRFINRYVLSQHILLGGGKSEIADSGTFQVLYGPGGNDMKVRYRQFELYAQLAGYRGMSRFEQLLDNLAAHQAQIRELIRPAWNTAENWFLADERINQIQRIVFLAAALYLEQGPFQSEHFAAWMRVCWNIMADPDIRSIPAMVTTMRTIGQLAAGSADIYGFLETDTFERSLADINNIHKEQLTEEQQKARLLREPGWAAAILRAEAHPLFQGNIGFLLLGEPDLELFELRARNAFLLFNRSGSDKSFRADYGVFRYVISSFATWDAIEHFVYADDVQNWQLTLRRNLSCKRSVGELCSSADSSGMRLMIDTALSRSSAATGGNSLRVRKLHENLYRSEAFTRWTQKNERVTKIKWLHDHHYLVRPGAWYDKVMIDCWRNEVVAAFVMLMNTTTKHRCGDSDMFWDEDFGFTVKKGEQLYALMVNRDNTVTIQKRKEHEGAISWPVQKKFPIDPVSSQPDAEELAAQIVAALNALPVEPAATGEEATAAI